MLLKFAFVICLVQGNANFMLINMLSHTPYNFLIWDMLSFSNWVWLGFSCGLKGMWWCSITSTKGSRYSNMWKSHHLLEMNVNVLHLMCQNIKIIAEYTFEYLLNEYLYSPISFWQVL